MQSIIIDLNNAKFCHTTKFNNANIILINTCAVTHKSITKSKNAIAKALKSKKCKIIIVMGCYSQIFKKWSNNKINIVIGNKFKNKIVPLIKQYLKTRKPIRKLVSINKLNKFENLTLPNFDNNTRAFLKIQDGCNQMCSYCLIPYARGRSRSKNHYCIIKEIKKLVNLNFKEIVLIGINLTSYNDGNYDFYDLLKDIDQIPGNFRIRISSLEPFGFKKEIIDLFANNQQRWCKQLHFCLQSASNKVLKAMNRPYTINFFLKLVKYARKKIKDVAITTDYIVGFPSETNKDFQQSIKNLKKLKFAQMNIFPFSLHKNTVAGQKYKSNLPQETLKYRLKVINELNNKYSLQYKKSLIGKKLSVIVQKKNDFYYGYSSEYVKVKIKNKIDQIRNKLVEITYNKNNLNDFSH